MPHDTAYALANPYLAEVALSGCLSIPPEAGVAEELRARETRERLVRQYAWAIPNAHALKVLQTVGPIVEIGAGGGYWARLLRDLGVDVLAYDPTPPDRDAELQASAWTAWTKVEVGGVEESALHPERTLLLCWPPIWSPMAADTLALYRGQRLAYIGESRGGECADDAFFDQLDADWDSATQVDLPQWLGSYDELTIYSRRAGR